MKARYARALFAAAFTVLFAGVGSAQIGTGDWGFQCIDPDNMMPRSDDYAVMGIGSALMRVHHGLSGTTTYGGQNGPCYGPTAVTLNMRGRIGFMYGSDGSIQDQYPADPANSSFSDNFMTLTVGMPADPGGHYSYVTTTKNGTRTLYGANPLSLAFVGASNRYWYSQSTNDNVFVQLRCDVVGDAARLQWTLTNLDADPANLGLWFGAIIGMLTNPFDFVVDRNGANQSGLGLPTLTRAFSAKEGHLVLPVGKPPRTEQRLVRAIDPANFPRFFDWQFGQTAGFGWRIDNGATEATKDLQGNSDATEAAENVFGNGEVFVLGGPGGDPTFPDFIFGDVFWLDNPGFIQKFAETPVPGNGGQRTIVQYLRTNWGVSNYALPYAVVVDAPQLVAYDADNVNSLRPNPMAIRVYVDNYGYGVINQEFPLEDVKVKLTLPQGINLAPGEVAEKIIPRVEPKQIVSVDFNIEADGIEFGNLEYTVVVDPFPGNPNNRKTLRGVVRVATTPRVNLVEGANLITVPWQFQDTSWEAILGLQTPIDFTAYKWDPEQNGYVVSTNAERGRAAWIVTNADLGSWVLQSNPQLPPDLINGAPVINLESGWTHVGNPYPYSVPLGQIVGVSASNPQQSYTWAQLVQQGIVNGAVVFWDTANQDYVFVQGSDELLLANRGYWVHINTIEDVAIRYPEVFIPFLPGSFRSSNERWVQTDKQWRLQLAVRSAKSHDSQNYLGFAKTAADARILRLVEPPISPVHDVQLAIEETVNGRPMRLAQSLTEKATRRAWKVFVSNSQPGAVTITWPNLSTVPKNLQFRITDLATNETRNLRQASGYTYNVDGPSMREFRLEVSPGVPAKAVIGNVVVSRAGRAANAPFAISYTLSTEAATTVRILSGAGREVFTVTRGRADRAGENSVTWTLKDNANRTVAPGSYRVEILAETVNGERVRRIVPINVVR